MAELIRNAGWTSAKSFLGVNALLNQRQSKAEDALERLITLFLKFASPSFFVSILLIWDHVTVEMPQFCLSSLLVLI